MLSTNQIAVPLLFGLAMMGQRTQGSGLESPTWCCSAPLGCCCLQWWNDRSAIVIAPVFGPVEPVLGLAELAPGPAPGPLPVLGFEEQDLPPGENLVRAD